MLDDLPIGHTGVEQRRALGMLGAPENRLGHAAVPDLTLGLTYRSAYSRYLDNKHLISGGGPAIC